MINRIQNNKLRSVKIISKKIETKLISNNIKLFGGFRK